MALKLEDYKADALSCPRCSNCKWVDHIYIQSHRFAKICPINTRYAFNAYSAQGILDIALALMAGQLDYTPGLLDVIYKCTLCGACDIRCKRNLDIEVLLVIEALRARCVQDGSGPLPEHKATASNIEKSHNRYGVPHKNRFKWLPKEIKPAEKADIVYFAGCNSSYRHPEIAQSTVKILAAAGSQFMMMSPDEWCCGHPLYITGQIDLAEKVARRNIEVLEKAGASAVLTSCAECYKTWKVDYPKLLGKSTRDMSFRVIHIAEYAEELLKQGALKLVKPVEMKVTYHDPCGLGRLSEPWILWEGVRKKYGVLDPPKEWRRGTNGVYEPPREILRSTPGIELVEMERIKENAWCCGAGGEVRTAFKDFSLWTAGERLEEAKSTGAEAIVSGCPYCKENLAEAGQLSEAGVKVYDLTEVMAQALG
jgi:Fe-S oxidoreductase